MKTKVYIASPYTKGDVAVNVKRQLDAADQLMTLGYAPFAPLYSHFQHMAHPRPYADWIAIDLEWVPACDVLLRLDGESSGADGEVAFARERGVPVVFSIEELLQRHPPGVEGTAPVQPKRYRWDQETDDTFGFMVGPVPDGEWVKWADVAHVYGVEGRKP